MYSPTCLRTGLTPPIFSTLEKHQAGLTPGAVVVNDSVSWLDIRCANRLTISKRGMGNTRQKRSNASAKSNSVAQLNTTANTCVSPVGDNGSCRSRSFVAIVATTFLADKVLCKP